MTDSQPPVGLSEKAAARVKALIEQQGDLRKLTRVVENVISQVEQIGDSGANNDGIEIPPHY